MDRRIFLKTLGAYILACSQLMAQNPPVTPAWAFGHIAWEDSLNTSQGAMKLVDGYLERGIPVNGVIIDSPWTLAYNDFNWDLERYPDPEGMISHFKSKNVKVLLWLTGVVNLEGKDTPRGKSETYDYVVAHDYGINRNQPRDWWKGKGVHVDFTNKEATEWWYGQLDKVFTDGVYGWKVDQGEFWFGDFPETSVGKLSNEQFRPYYYNAMYDYTVGRNPKGVIIARPFSHQGGCAASVEKLSVGWCGDFSGDWEGLKEQIRNIYLSAKRGYGSLACEIGGFFRKRPDKRQLVRYAQFGCMTACMINGGENGAFSNHLPWHHGKDVEDIYRYCVSLHGELAPYLFSTVVDAHLAGGTLIRNASLEEESHQVGDFLFTKAITSARDTVSFHLPGNGEWIDFWNGEKYAAGSVVAAAYPLNRFPLFVKSGAIIPLNVTTRVTGLGDETMKGRRAILVYPNGKSRNLLHLPVDDGTAYEDCLVDYDENRKLLAVSGKEVAPYTFIIKDIPEVGDVKNASSWKYDKGRKELRVTAEGRELEIQIL